MCSRCEKKQHCMCCVSALVDTLLFLMAVRRNYGIDNRHGRRTSRAEVRGGNGSLHFHPASAGLASEVKPFVRSVKFAVNEGGRRECRNCPDPPWVPGDEDSVAVQKAVHALFQMGLIGASFEGCCFTLPGQGETEWLQV
eukprot:SAG22_NODE_111_length_19607_cov_12.696637_12_plen_140_part_00